MENQLVTILRITTPQLGSFVKNMLEAEGIECFFTNEGLTLGDVYNPDEVLLNVKAKHSEKAVKILLELHQEYDLDKIREDKSYLNLKKIIFPIKLSENCVELCKYAVSLAKIIHAEIKFLHIYEDPTQNAPVKHTVSWEKHVRMQLRKEYQKAQLKMVDFTIELKKKIPAALFESVKMHYRILKGSPEHAIIDACNRYKPSFVLMGISGDSENGEFMGKTTAKVIEHSNYPVWVIPDSAELNISNKLNVMYGTNFYETDNSSLNKLLKILESFKKDIHCIHIDMHEDKHHQEKVDEVNKMLMQNYSDHHIQCKLFESDNIIKGFDRFVEEHNIDLISFSKIRRSAFYKMFHSNHLVKLVSTEKVPMLIFPV